MQTSRQNVYTQHFHPYILPQPIWETITVICVANSFLCFGACTTKARRRGEKKNIDYKSSKIRIFVSAAMS
jgi:hypothetical protein